MEQTKILLGVEDVPKAYYNIQADLAKPLPPPLHPLTDEPVTPELMTMLFPKEFVMQEMSREQNIPIAPELRQMYIDFSRPTPLQRAVRLEKYLKTPAKIYYKREDLNPCGSHKPNTALAQSYMAAKEGVHALATETGAGQWGTSLAYSNMLFGLKTKVFMVRTSFESKPFRKVMMQMYGAEVYPSPSKATKYGAKVLAEKPDHPGSLGIAISEAIETVMESKGAIKYSLGSVLNAVLMHQTVIGLEVKKQFEMLDAMPDVMVGCVGGGSNFGGFVFPYAGDILKKKAKIKLVAVEPKSVPSMTKGEYRYDFGDTAGMAPKVKMHTLGHDFIPSAIHAGGLRYHGCAPAVSALIDQKIVSPVAYDQLETFEAANVFARTEGIIAAPESAHAIKGAMEEALSCKKKNEEKTIVFNLSGHGLLDLKGYQEYLEGKLK